MRASDHWYKNSVVYAVDVGRFDDSDGDGTGDFAGQRTDWITCLVSASWTSS